MTAFKLFTRGNPTFEELVFISAIYIYDRQNDKITGYQYISVTPDDFKKFLNNWFGFRQGLHVPVNFVAESLKLAA
jgi:hypothetical protein